jgi:predicted TIM-barrel fold metal-dependent hydrolase
VHACGACGVGECLPQAQHEAGIAHPAWDALIAGCSSMEWPILVHLTDPHGPAYAGRVETPLDAMLNCFAAHPRQHFIAAHWAGGLPLSAHGAAALRALPNVWLDTAASARLYPPSVWRQAFDMVGSQRIIFGSDFPLRNYPYKKEPHGPGWQGLLQEIAAAGLAMTEREALLGGNLQRLLMLAAGRSRD